MPSHVPQPVNDPPSFFDRLRIHSSDVWLAVLAITVGVVVTVGRLSRVMTSTSLSSLDDWLPIALAAVMVVGGLVAVTGLLWTGRTESRGWTLEQSGWWMVASAWAGYAIAVVSSPTGTIAGVAISSVLAAAAACRALVVAGIERRRRRETGTDGARGGVR